MEGFFFGINYLSHKLFFRTFRQKNQGSRRWRGTPSPTLPMNQIASDLPPLGFKSSFPFENPKRCALESAYGTTWQKDAVLHFCPAMKIRRCAHDTSLQMLREFGKCPCTSQETNTHCMCSALRLRKFGNCKMCTYVLRQ